MSALVGFLILNGVVTNCCSESIDIVHSAGFGQKLCRLDGLIDVWHYFGFISTLNVCCSAANITVSSSSITTQTSLKAVLCH